MMTNNNWFLEKRTTTDWHLYGIIKMIYETKSKFQQIQVFETHDYGTCLALDGKARVFSIDEFIFHESFVHPVMSYNSNSKNILLAGDGDGGSVREILKYPINKLTWVELDNIVIDVSQKYLGIVSKETLNDPRLNLIPPVNY